MPFVRVVANYAIYGKGVFRLATCVCGSWGCASIRQTRDRYQRRLFPTSICLQLSAAPPLDSIGSSSVNPDLERRSSTVCSRYSRSRQTPRGTGVPNKRRAGFSNAQCAPRIDCCTPGVKVNYWSLLHVSLTPAPYCVNSRRIRNRWPLSTSFPGDLTAVPACRYPENTA